MPTEGEGTFRNADWDEAILESFYGGAKLSRVLLTREYQGEIVGKSTVHYLMATSELGDVRFVGMEVLNGQVGSYNGTIVIQHVGTFNNDTAGSAWTFVEGTGTGDMSRIAGDGTFTSIDQETASYTVNYTADL